MSIKAMGAEITFSVTSVDREGCDAHRSKTIHKFPLESLSLETSQTLHVLLVCLNFTPK